MLNDPLILSSEEGGTPPEGTLAQAPQPPPAPREIWTWRDLLIMLACIPFALLASKIAVLIGYVLLRPFTGWRLNAELVQSETVFLLVQQCVFYVFILGFLVLLARVHHEQPFWRSLGWKKPAARHVAGYLAGGASLALLVSLILFMQPDPQGFPLEKLFNSRAACYAIGAFAIAIAPVVEELVFRGLLFALVERAAGIHLAVVATAVLFAGLHVPEYWPAWNHMLMILVVGLVFSMARGRTRSLAPSIVLHIGYNTLMIASLFFSSQHFRAVWR